MGLMCISDMVITFGDEVMPLLDEGGAEKPAGSVLNQLLLKATSNDKRFVVDEATRALEIITEHVSCATLDNMQGACSLPMWLPMLVAF